MRHISFSCLLVLWAACPALATDWFVAPPPLGSDTNSGTSAADPFATIGKGILSAGSGDVVHVAAGTYNEQPTVNKAISLIGEQAGIDACSRPGTGESIITNAADILTLVTGSAGATIDGFTFQGGAKQIKSSSGPIDGLHIENNRFLDFTGTAIFLNDSGTDVTIDSNSIDGSLQSSGGAIHLDQDSFDGFLLSNNCIRNAVTGLFVDGNRNVGASAGRNPGFFDNLFEQNVVGMNLGTRAVEDGTIEDNAFLQNEYDGIQGGTKNVLIQHNIFTSNGRAGLRLTDFASTAADKGSFDTTVSENCFFDNGLVQADGGGVRFDDASPTVSPSTNVVTSNNFAGNSTGFLNTSSVSIDATNNFWGSSDGPSGAGPGTGDAVSNTGGGSTTVAPFSSNSVAGTPCSPVLAFELRTPTVLGPGEPIRVYLDVTSSRSELASVGARLTYDDSKVILVSIAKGSAAPSSWSFAYENDANAGEVDFVLTDQTASAATIAGPVTDAEIVCIEFSRTGVNCDPVSFGFNASSPATAAEIAAFPENQYIHYLELSTMTVRIDIAEENPTTGPTVDDHGFIRGNVNNRAAHLLDIGDIVDLANFLFASYVPGFTCPAAFDTNNDGVHNITDLVTSVQGIFNAGAVLIAAPNFINPGPGIPGVVVPDGGSIPSVLGCAQGETCP